MAAPESLRSLVYSIPEANGVQSIADVDKIQLPREHGIKLVGVCVGKEDKEYALIYCKEKVKRFFDNSERYRYLSSRYNFAL